jgi:hypothetical protein
MKITGEIARVKDIQTDTNKDMNRDTVQNDRGIEFRNCPQANIILGLHGILAVIHLADGQEMTEIPTIQDIIHHQLDPFIEIPAIDHLDPTHITQENTTQFHTEILPSNSSIVSNDVHRILEDLPQTFGRIMI